MKRRLKLAVALTGLIYVLAACKEDCRKKPCENGGVCVDGSCQCSFPWEGYLCRSHANQKFTGNWQASSDCTGSRDTFKMKIKAEGTQLWIIDEPVHSFDLNATLIGSTNFDVPAQRHRSPLLGSMTISGRGEYRSGLIYLYLRYDYDANFWDRECTHTLIRR